MHALEKEVVALGRWGFWVCFSPLLSKGTSSVSLPIATMCWKVKRCIFAVPLPYNKGFSNRMLPDWWSSTWCLSRLARFADEAYLLSTFCTRVRDKSGWLLAAVNVSVSASLLQSLPASFPPSAGAGLMIGKCTVILLRKINQLKQGVIHPDSFQFSTD